jgi:protein-L-isoaspartate(D-aspartate) O-methyltransferase
MDFNQARFNMVEQQIRPWEVLDQDVLDLMSTIRREDFVPPAYRTLAFADTQVPLGHGAAMLAPKIEAKLLQALQVRKSDKVLEIGAGSGFMAALLGAKADHVYSVEIVPELAAFASENLRRAGIENVTVLTGDGARGWPAHAPYDVIVVSASLPVVPRELLDQLKPGGRLAAIVGDPPAMQAQIVTRLADATVETVSVFETDVTPLRNAVRPEGFVL